MMTKSTRQLTYGLANLFFWKL